MVWKSGLTQPTIYSALASAYAIAVQATPTALGTKARLYRSPAERYPWGVAGDGERLARRRAMKSFKLYRVKLF